MSWKNKALPAALLLLVMAGALFSCGGQLGGKSGPQIVKAEDGGEEEVLSEDDDDRDEFGRPKNDGADGPQGALIAVTYLIMTIGAAVMPFLFLL